LTIAACQQAVTLLQKLGVPGGALTLLAVPHHEEWVELDKHPPTIRFLRELENRGACVVMHGLTHRMEGRVWSPLGIARAYLFARGQGELYNQNTDETARRLDRGQEILYRAGLLRAAQAFVPPAWLLSLAARRAIAGRGFDFYEVLGGIVGRGRLGARRLLGWQAVSVAETRIASVLSPWQRRPPDQDMRLAIHPDDIARPQQQRAICDVVTGLLPQVHLSNYLTYLGDRGNPLSPPPSPELMRTAS
jgi:predicted deacetylase